MERGTSLRTNPFNFTAIITPTYSPRCRICYGVCLPRDAHRRAAVAGSGHPVGAQTKRMCSSVFLTTCAFICIRSTNIGIQIQIQRATQPRGSASFWLGLALRARRGRDVQGRARCRRGLPRHVGHKGALASLGHHEMQGTGTHVFWWRG